jgi:hypothetical protein
LTRRVTALGASLVCSVDRTRWPVCAAWALGEREAGLLGHGHLRDEPHGLWRDRHDLDVDARDAQLIGDQFGQLRLGDVAEVDQQSADAILPDLLEVERLLQLRG